MIRLCCRTEKYTDPAILKSPIQNYEGLYHCKHPERGESPQSWISVRGSTYSAVKVGVAVTLSLFLIILILSLFWCYKRKKGNQQDTNQTSDQSQDPGPTPLQADDSAADDVTYAQVVTTKNEKKLRGKVKEPEEVTYSQIAMKNLKQDGK
ncbi:hypothetical protein NFI96_024444, partial [Prochilodus magdalenae]